ncbi:hypothetical protein HQ531_03550 [bacterium]|nr:hypothetical protein [bacterium]
MSYSAILALLNTIISGVAGTGKVHDYQRLARTEQEFITLFTTDSVVNGWQITRRSTANSFEDSEELDGTLMESVYEYIMTGFYGIDDAAATEKTFQNIVEAVSDALANDETMKAAGYNTGEPQILVVEPRAFGPVLCHVAEVSIQIAELKEV